ncbi:DUF309 domain-containing protein [Pseudonocardia sp.]|uniref:DUF309 domain-containing protein n=1 Tax=Pseudonocardia sp. TaxID=60912 RepID=UPI00262EF793|nr:DUF309 domain-containing protein [Pseudonocardia sp.]
MDRDRDGSGRARNARPRDAAGRPLPRGSVGVERLPDELVLSADQAVDQAQELLDGGQPFAAHEVLEAAWKAAAPAERELWRGLAQLAVGLTHAQRGNPRGAVSLLDRGQDHLRRWVGVAPAGLDVTALAARADRLARRIEDGGTGALSPDDLRPRLRPDGRSPESR